MGSSARTGEGTGEDIWVRERVADGWFGLDLRMFDEVFSWRQKGMRLSILNMALDLWLWNCVVLVIPG